LVAGAHTATPPPPKSFPVDMFARAGLSVEILETDLSSSRTNYNLTRPIGLRDPKPFFFELPGRLRFMLRPKRFSFKFGGIPLFRLGDSVELARRCQHVEFFLIQPHSTVPPEIFLGSLFPL